MLKLSQQVSQAAISKRLADSAPFISASRNVRSLSLLKAIQLVSVILRLLPEFYVILFISLISLFKRA
ncbi:hypothetical protein L211DRAFT_231321 [Terfezia boudieri ATCC MYA-4762]|uniref:Uncharacterized protein n=1 Tax=Terfezia boudieri ATCC MYA-4762 TaxID=1051890 RepID=A0A3N4L668_9PEZI|nr:hypothetical protein L211DRAFT_231321 [Terfezia boudieri ATCC MYA-4762]